MAEIAVVLPTARVDAWLDEAVWSVLSQDADLRLVVFHDGIVPHPGRSWTRHPHVTVMQSPRRTGLAAALRAAVAATTEPFIARLDADDLALPGRLAAQTATLREEPDLVLVGSLAIRIDADGRRTGLLGTVVGDDVRTELVHRNVLMHSSVAFRRSSYEAVGGYDRSLRTMEDYELWLRMARTGRVAVTAPRHLAYRVHGAQMSRSASPVGRHIAKVMVGQGRLGHHLGLAWPSHLVTGATWWGAQMLRSSRLRRPGYEV